jgi:DNA-binding MarR family transcriptional regulator
LTLGLIEQKAIASDWRACALHLTTRGKDRLQAIGRLARDHQQALCAGLDAAEQEISGNLLSKIANHQRLKPGVHPGYRTLDGSGAQGD